MKVEKNPQLSPFTGLSCPSLTIPHACAYFFKISPNLLKICINQRL